MQDVLDQLFAELGEKAPQLMVAVVVLLLTIGLAQLVGLTVGRILTRTRRGDRYRRPVRRLITWAGTAFGILLALQILDYTAVANSVLATGGVAAVILGFAFKDIGENLLAGIFLAFSRSFDVGDLIESEGLRGVVKAIDLRDTHIRTDDGCDIFIPSSQIFRQPLLNYTRDGLRRGSFTIGIDYGDDPDQALRTLREAVSATPGVLEVPEPRFQISKFDGSWMELQIHLWVNTKEAERADMSLSTIRTRAMSSARHALLDAGFTLSSNTTTALAIPPLDVALTTERSPSNES